MLFAILCIARKGILVLLKCYFAILCIVRSCGATSNHRPPPLSLSIFSRRQAPLLKADTSGTSGASGGSDPRWTMGAGFHHKSHLGRRVNCLLWSSGGGELFSVCDGGTVVLAKNLRPRRGVPAAGPAGMMGVVSDGGRVLRYRGIILVALNFPEPPRLRRSIPQPKLTFENMCRLSPTNNPIYYYGGPQ